MDTSTAWGTWGDLPVGRCRVYLFPKITRLKGTLVSYDWPLYHTEAFCGASCVPSCPSAGWHYIPYVRRDMTSCIIVGYRERHIELYLGEQHGSDLPKKFVEQCLDREVFPLCPAFPDNNNPLIFVYEGPFCDCLLLTSSFLSVTISPIL